MDAPPDVEKVVAETIRDLIRALIATLEDEARIAAVVSVDEGKDTPQYRQRLGQMGALAVVIEYLERVGLEHRLLLPLIELQGALIDDAGQIGKQGKPPIGTIESEIRAFAAVTVTLLLRASQPNAFQTVARIVGTTANTIKIWRKEMTRGRGQQSQTGERYTSYLRQANARTTLTPSQRADWAVAVLRERIVARVAAKVA